MKEILTFFIGKELFGVDISRVSEIIRSNYHITPIPNSEKHILGIFQPRDMTLTAIDLQYCLYNKNNDNIESKYFIMTENNQAWLIDNANDIKAFEEKEILDPTPLVRNEKTFISGVYPSPDGELIQIIDFDLIHKALDK